MVMMLALRITVSGSLGALVVISSCVKPSPQCPIRAQWFILMKREKHKSEARNPKQYLMIKIQTVQTIERERTSECVCVLPLGHLIFGFVSEFRISIFEFCYRICLNYALWA
jgi:hypothetical protein